MSKKFTIEEVKTYAENAGFSLLSTIYEGNNKKLSFFCKIHGKFEINFNNFKNGHTCKKCARKAIGARQAKDPLKFAEEVVKTKYTLLSKYSRDYIKVDMNCPNHGKFSITPHDFLSGKGCRQCGFEASSQKRAKESPRFKEILNKKSYTLLTPYERSAKKVSINCTIHGPFEMSPNSIIAGQGCPKCGYSKAGFKRRSDAEKFKKIVNNLGYKLITPYILSNQKVTIECIKHGQFDVTPGNFNQGHHCSKCASIITKPHQEIIDYIKSIYFGDIDVNNRKILGGPELDIYVPFHNFGIEFDGLHWHSEFCRERPDLDNIKKIEKVFEKNVKFLAVFEDEWKNPIKQQIIKSMIASRLQINQTTIYARDTEFKEITNKEAENFLELNHIDGSSLCSKAFGLFYKDKLVMCMTFRKNFNKEHEIARMASLLNHSIVGGASKLLSHADKPLISYSNNRLSMGNIYKTLGFEEITKIKNPSYYYTDFKKRVWRFKCRKIEGLPGTEREQALNGAFFTHFGHAGPVYRIYDYGHRKWFLK